LLDDLIASERYPPSLMGDKDKIEALIMEHSERRPLMRATDFYKLLHQGAFGVVHIMAEGAWDWLKKEVEGLNLHEQPEEPLLEKVSAYGTMVRVNLRPYLKKGLPLEGLFTAMKEASRVEGSSEEFMEAWAVLKALVVSGNLKVDLVEFETLDVELRREGCHPHHHSETYRDAYHPAYRVVTRESLAGVLGQEERDQASERVP
jgi:hypothetical protein